MHKNEVLVHLYLVQYLGTKTYSSEYFVVFIGEVFWSQGINVPL